MAAGKVTAKKRRVYFELNAPTARKIEFIHRAVARLAG